MDSSYSESTVLSTDGVPIYYRIYGAGAPTVLFVHGWSGDQTYWKAQAQYFSSHTTVVTLDLAGHGNSGNHRHDWSVSAFAQDVVSVVEALDLTQLILIGHSMGGPVVLETACRIPSRVSAIVGVDTFPDKWFTFDDLLRNQFLEPFRKNFVETTYKWVSQQLFLPTSNSNLVQRIASDMSSSDPKSGIASMESIYEWGKNEGLRSFRKLCSPVFMIQAKRNENNLQVVSSLSTFFQLEVYLMSEVGHFPMMEDAETFNRILHQVIEPFSRPGL
ncbi:MAG: alpha/beta hydrolase [Acidobacteriota bacterium]|nr:alpha/beta hydrolase [Acidobacteriota bacterium]